MSTSPMRGTLGAALFFSLLAALAFPVGLPGTGDSRKSLDSLPGEEEIMAAGRDFHLKTGPPEFPDPAPFCFTCHSLPPHPGGGTSPAFLNQHSTNFDCLVCHWGKALGGQPDLTWDRRPQREGGDAEESPEGALVLRIAGPLEGGKRDPADLRRKVTETRVCFERGPVCKACHGGGSLGKYARPGMSVDSEKALESLREIFFLSKGEKWYFPR
jgi:hypothetical protein